MFRRGSSRRIDVKCGEGRLLLPALLFGVFLGFAPAGLTPLGHPLAWAQAPSSPSPSEAPQPQDSAPSSPQQPSAPPGPQQQPAAAPPWTPPVAPAPSQSHVPGLFVPPVGIAPGATFEYHSTLTLSEEYSDNFNLATSEQGKQSNFRTTLSPGSTILINTAKTQGSVSASSGFTYDSSTGPGDFDFFPSLSASIRHSFNPRLSLTLTDSFNRNDSPSVADSSGLRQERQTFISNSFGASVDWLIDLLQTQYYYRNSYFSTSDTDGNSGSTSQSDSTTTSQIFGLGASTRVGALNTVRVGYEYSINEPREDETSYGNLFSASVSHQLGTYASAGVQGSYSMQTVDDVKIWNGSVFGTYGLPTGFSFSGSLGYTLVNSDVASNQGGVSGNINASYAHARGVISLGIFRDYRTTFQGGRFGQSGVDESGQDFGVVQTLGVTGNFTYQLTPLVGSFVQAAYTQNENTGIGNTDSNTSQDFFTASAGVNWSVLHWLNLSLRLTHNQYSQPDRSENRGLLSLNARF